MGYQTVVMVLNDAMDQLEKNEKQFINAVTSACHIRKPSEIFALGNYANPVKVFDSQHADTPQLLLAYHNDFLRFGYNSDLTNPISLGYRKRMLEVAKSVLADEERIIKELEKKVEK